MIRHHRLTLLVLLVALWAFSPVLAGGETEELVLSLQDIDCQSCGQSVAKMLRREKGVRSASFDQTSAEITIVLGVTPPTAEKLLSLVHRAGYRAVLGAGAGRYLPAVEFPDGLDIDWLSRAGEEADVAGGLVAGKVTVIDYYAIWCGPCREIDREMKKILVEADDVALRKINVVDWSSPVAKQQLRNVGGLPYVEVYAKNGKKVASIEVLDLDRLHKAIEKGRSR